MISWTVLVIQYIQSLAIPLVIEKPSFIELNEYLSVNYFLVSQLVIVSVSNIIFLVYYLVDLNEFTEYFSIRNYQSLKRHANKNLSSASDDASDVAKFCCLCNLCQQKVTD